jgi:hypothetical protein
VAADGTLAFELMVLADAPAHAELHEKWSINFFDAATGLEADHEFQPDPVSFARSLHMGSLFERRQA